MNPLDADAFLQENGAKPTPGLFGGADEEAGPAHQTAPAVNPLQQTAKAQPRSEAGQAKAAERSQAMFTEAMRPARQPGLPGMEDAGDTQGRLFGNHGNNKAIETKGNDILDAPLTPSVFSFCVAPV